MKKQKQTRKTKRKYVRKNARATGTTSETVTVVTGLPNGRSYTERWEAVTGRRYRTYHKGEKVPNAPKFTIDDTVMTPEMVARDKAYKAGHADGYAVGERAGKGEMAAHMEATIRGLQEMQRALAGSRF